MSTSDYADLGKILDRITKLIMLASSPAEAEAAQAATRACRLIRDHGLTLIDPAHPHIAPASAMAELAQLRRTVANMARRIAELEAIERLLRETAHSTPGPAPIRRITSKFDGFCKSCGAPYDVDDVVLWRPGFGCWHTHCATPPE